MYTIAAFSLTLITIAEWLRHSVDTRIQLKDCQVKCKAPRSLHVDSDGDRNEPDYEEPTGVLCPGLHRL